MKRGRVPPRTVTSRDELFWRPKLFPTGNANDVEMGLYEFTNKRMLEDETTKRQQTKIGGKLPEGLRKD